MPRFREQFEFPSKKQTVKSTLIVRIGLLYSGGSKGAWTYPLNCSIYYKILSYVEESKEDNASKFNKNNNTQLLIEGVGGVVVVVVVCVCVCVCVCVWGGGG